MSDTHDHDHEILTYADDSRHDVDENARYVLMAEAIRELLIESTLPPRIAPAGGGGGGIGGGGAAGG